MELGGTRSIRDDVTAVGFSVKLENSL